MRRYVQYVRLPRFPFSRLMPRCRCSIHKISSGNYLLKDAHVSEVYKKPLFISLFKSLTFLEKKKELVTAA